MARLRIRPQMCPLIWMMSSTATRVSRILAPALFALCLLLLAWILSSSLASAVRDPKADDGYYLRYMRTVHHSGLAAFPSLFDKWNATPRHWNFPPPSRVGFIVISALWARLFGATAHALQLLSLASHLLLCVVSYVFARRHFGEPRALFIGVSIGFSALLMGLSRLALTDSFNALCMTTTVWLFLDLLREPRGFLRGLPFMAALAFMVISKELSVLLVVPFGTFLLYERLIRRVPHDLLRFSMWFLVPGVVTAAILVLSAGSLPKLAETLRIVLTSPETNKYAIRHGLGPWFRPILDYLLFSPGPTLLAIGWMAVTAVRLRAGEYDRASVFLGLLAAFLILELSFFTKNIRYAVVLELPIRVFSVLMISELFGWLRLRRAAATAGLVVGWLVWLDWDSFDLIWVEWRGYDPITAFLAIVREFIPARTR